MYLLSTYPEYRVHGTYLLKKKIKNLEIRKANFEVFGQKRATFRVTHPTPRARLSPYASTGFERSRP
jgi:hypothetical protein